MPPVNRWTSVLALLLCACGSSETPLPPSIVSVTPQRVSMSECTLLTVALEGELPLKLDYGKGSVEVGTLAQVVEVSGRNAPVLGVEGQGRRIITDLQAGLPVGTHDVRVTLQDGRQALLPDGLEVTPPLALETFRIDPIIDQVREEPFTVTIRAVGPDAHRFQGRVLLRSNRGTLQPAWSQPFQQGVLTQEISIDAVGGNNVLIELTDCSGRMTNSNDFRLEPKP